MRRECCSFLAGNYHGAIFSGEKGNIAFYIFACARVHIFLHRGTTFFFQAVFSMNAIKGMFKARAIRLKRSVVSGVTPFSYFCTC